MQNPAPHTDREGEEKLRMVDLFCGRGGWTKGFMAHGWECIGIDLHPQPDYPGTFIQADIAQMVELPPADFYCCSSPCEQFSVHGMKHFHPNPKWPWLGLALFEHSRQLLEATGKPYIMENVRVAQKFVGKSQGHCGSFYFWGQVPAIMPPRVHKGFHHKGGRSHPINGRLSSGKAAEIPQSISLHIAEMAVSL